MLTVVVVEDNPGDVHLIREGLEASGREVSLSVFTDGTSALQYLTGEEHLTSGASATNPETDLVLLDLNLPKTTGTDVLEQLERGPARRPTRTCVLSGSESTEHVRETRETGADEYYVKPVDPHAYVTIVAEIVESVATNGPLPTGEFARLDGRS